jgi:integrase
VSYWSPATLRICYAGIRFFFEKVLQRDWPLLQLLRAQRERKLPAVLSVEEVRRALGSVRTFHNYAFLTTVYSCGLRLQEGLHLEVSDIDSARMMVHVHRGKGAKDRYVPLPGSTLGLLRKYWVTHRNPGSSSRGRPGAGGAGSRHPDGHLQRAGGLPAGRAGGRHP